MSDLSDKDIIQMLKTSNTSDRNSALTEVYKINFHQVSVYVLKNSGTNADAEDIFQDGLIALYQQILDNRFKGDSTIGTYLYAICRNLWMKRLRKSSTRKEGFDIDPAMAADDNLAIDDLIADEESLALANLMNKIGEGCKKVLRYFYYEKRRMQEIAELLGFANEQVAKNKKNRCLKQLRKMAHELPQFKTF